jgi:hypothetical protein
VRDWYRIHGARFMVYIGVLLGFASRTDDLLSIREASARSAPEISLEYMFLPRYLYEAQDGSYNMLPRQCIDLRTCQDRQTCSF